MPRLAVNIVTWNSELYIGACLDALSQQTYQDFGITVVDNNSEDGSAAVVRDYADHGVRLFQSATNEGYAPAHNKAIAATDSEFVLNLNPDVILTSTYLEYMVQAISENDSIGSVAGRLLSVSPEQFAEGLAALTNLPPRLIDGAGLIMYRNRRQFLRGNAQDSTQYCLDRALIFGPDGAAPLYRRAMLQDIRVDGEYFDESFRSHKKDVDVAWRAQLLGWQSVYTPLATAYHIRGFRPGKRVHLADSIKRDAVKNRWLMNLKNELPRLFFRDVIKITAYEIRILGYLILFERSSLPALLDVVRLLPRAMAHRREIQQRRKRDYQYMRQWFV